MAETKNTKGFRPGVYAVIVGLVIAVVLTALTVFAFTTRYTAYSPEKVAQTYVDTIVQSGDGYNAYKNTLLSQNKKLKYGDFIRNAYMKPYVNEKDADGKKIPQAEFVGTGSAEEQKAIDEVYNTMYDYFVELLGTYGFDDYDSIFNHYFAKLKEVRHSVYGDDFMNTDYMFGAFEANVAAYGESLTGNKEVLAADKKTVLKEAKDGKYQERFGKDYKLTAKVVSCEELSESDTKAYAEAFRSRIAPVAESGEAKADAFGLQDTEREKKVLFFKKTEKDNAKSNMINAFEKLNCADAISSVAKVVVEVKDQNGNTVVTQELYVVKIDNSWYVDNTNADTSGLYLEK